MKYMGSKSKIAKYIVPILENIYKTYSCNKYIEPFVGGANVIDKIGNVPKIAGDKNIFLIEMYRHMEEVATTMPEMVDKNLYDLVREDFNKSSGVYPNWFVGAVGFLASYNGRFFDGGYSGERSTKDGGVRNYYQEAKRGFVKQCGLLKGVNFLAGDYTQFTQESHALIYCDPPYKNTKQYGVSRDFDHEAFWEWCRQMSRHNTVVISEQQAPLDFKCIWEIPIKRTIDINSTVTATEKLFMWDKANPYTETETTFSELELF